MKILIATHNPSKLHRYQQMLKDFDVDLISLADIGIADKIDEPFATAKENAIHKAKFYAKIANIPTLAIDESARTNFLPENEQPGVYVRRHMNTDVEMTDEESLVHWKNIIDSNPVVDKSFDWNFSIAFYDPESDILKTSLAVMKSKVTSNFSSIVQKGYPMSSFMINEGYDKPRSELTEDEWLGVDKKVYKNFLEDFKSWIH
jgi:XTP/dITP diphosphohydrolase